MTQTSSRIIPLLLRPLDGLFFRDARPFAARDSGRSTLPTPQSAFGAMKTHLMRTLRLAPNDLHGLHPGGPQEQSPHSWLGAMRVRGPWLYLQKTAFGGGVGPLVRAPADLVVPKHAPAGDAPKAIRLRPLDAPPPYWAPAESELLPLWSPIHEPVAPVDGFLDLSNLKSYLRGEESPSIIPSRRLFQWSRRTGIGVDPDAACTGDGDIYSTSNLFLSPNVCFYIEVLLPQTAPPPDTLFPANLSLPWGGEGHRVEVQRLPTPAQWPFVPPVDGRLLSLLITPGIFSDAGHTWKPQQRGALVSASIPRPLPISGWDLAGDAQSGRRPGPRPTRFAVPAGAVYLWKRSDRKAMPGEPDGPPAVDNLADRPRDADAGWGVSLCGTWHFHSPSPPGKGRAA